MKFKWGWNTLDICVFFMRNIISLILGRNMNVLFEINDKHVIISEALRALGICHAFNTIVIRISRYVDFFQKCIFNRDVKIYWFDAQGFILHCRLLCVKVPHQCCWLTAVMILINTRWEKTKLRTYLCFSLRILKIWCLFLVESSKLHLHPLLLFYY